jgi:hypothetical protein
MKKIKKGDKILIVDDDMGLLNELSEAITDEFGLKVFSANSIFLAKTILNKHSDISLVAVDGDLKDGGDIEKTSALVRDIFVNNAYKTKDAVGIAISSSSEYNKVLCDSGCKLKVNNNKFDLIPIIDSLLKNNP